MGTFDNFFSDIGSTFDSVDDFFGSLFDSSDVSKVFSSVSSAMGGGSKSGGGSDSFVPSDMSPSSPMGKGLKDIVSATLDKKLADMTEDKGAIESIKYQDLVANWVQKMQGFANGEK